MLYPSQEVKISASWLVDSRATDHICQSLIMFDSYDTIKPFTVRLSNGISVQSNIAGTVKIMDDFVLFDVFYLPHFQFNLHSISKLVKGDQYQAMFSDDSCTIQDSSSKMISLAKLENGLYYLHNDGMSLPLVNNVICNSNSVPKSALWYFRFGNASSHRLDPWCKIFPSVNVNKNSL